MHFSWQRINSERFEVTVKTPVTRIGTLYRLTSAIYLAGLDIEDGQVDTHHEGDVDFTVDHFVLRIDENISNSVDSDVSVKLGVFMETLLDDTTDPDVLLLQHGVRIPELSSFFETQPEIVFEDLNESRETQFYIETLNRRGLLFHLTRILAEENISIVRGEIHTHDGGRAEDSFFLQYEGDMLGEKLAKKLEGRILGKE